MIEPIRVRGLAEFNRNLRKINSDLPKALRLAHNEGAEFIAGEARPQVPSRSGRAKATVKARSTRTASRVQGGSKRVPYYPWLDFGGRVGPGKAVSRPYIKQGRYIYPALGANYKRLAEILTDALIDVARQAGVEVSE
ncbi:hypothetical protein BLA60_25850 [Actinophytocola xinjiangensis]|uniref:HK97 gp10 family phage protein n=1 Tax=Actinophytocola xinjiangensis TaxID=485602 RepID=A0A7Z0WI61_9PSEU|nr:hypothetical protein [Actinophytocola xinjiangensis]OLF07756.1 hypothetical protein BLA60_25850 [Actinophytocola xinjiangensis]